MADQQETIATPFFHAHQLAIEGVMPNLGTCAKVVLLI